MRLDFETCDVFTATRFGGNPLAVVFGADALGTEAMQRLAREFNLSETVFVLAEDAAAATACIRIFTPRIEMPFAGHPNVGAAVVLARRMGLAGDAIALDQPAGRVAARISRDGAGRPVGAAITAPRPFALGAAAALAAAAPDAGAFRAGLPVDVAVGLHLFARLGAGRLRARMFAPLGGVEEDPATGSANVALGGLLLHRAGGAALALEVEQGVEMGRPSLLALAARRTPEGIRVEVGGGVVRVAAGTIEALPG